MMEGKKGLSWSRFTRVHTEKSYTVKSPWELVYGSIKKGNNGISYEKYVNVFISYFIPTHMDKQPVLKIDNSCPFWEMDGKGWDIFKKRVIGFSKAVRGICCIGEGDMEDLKERANGVVLYG